ncbi:hypothetical protein HYC85_020688, partial [Camellia sinensis]
FFTISTTASHPHPHPLDSLTPQEVRRAKQAYPSLWLSTAATTTPPPRRAFVITRLNKHTHEITVDLSTQSIVSDHIYAGHGYPLFTLEEQTAAIDLPMTYPPFLESVKKRGLDIFDVVCSTFSVGWFGEEGESPRVLKILCFYVDGTVNLYVRPMKGVTLVVDLDEIKIIEYTDRFTVPVAKARGTEYRAAKQKPPFGPPLKGVATVQPDGSGIEIDGHTISVFSTSRPNKQQHSSDEGFTFTLTHHSHSHAALASVEPILILTGEPILTDGELHPHRRQTPPLQPLQSTLLPPKLSTEALYKLQSTVSCILISIWNLRMTVIGS